MSKIELRESSKQQYSIDNPSLEHINTGCLQRIAAATELMSSSYSVIINDRNYYQERLKQEQNCTKRMANQIRGLKSALTKLKNLQS